MIDSMRNWARMSRRFAPSALRMPISRVRSVTVMSMMFMMPMPPTTREMPAISVMTVVMMSKTLFVVWMLSSALRTTNRGLPSIVPYL